VKLRKLIMGVALIGLPLGALSAAATTGLASAGSPAPGTVTCTKIAGTVTFKPGLKLSTSATVTTKIKVTISGCTASVGKSPKKGTASVTTVTPNDTCSGLANGSTTAEDLTTKWSPTSIAPSTADFSGFDPVTNGAGDSGFSLPNSPGGSVSVTGSYAGADGGATSTAQVFSNETAAQIATACSSAKGLTSLKLTTGSTFLG
jgi:hypothetical protein